MQEVIRDIPDPKYMPGDTVLCEWGCGARVFEIEKCQYELGKWYYLDRAEFVTIEEGVIRKLANDSQ